MYKLSKFTKVEKSKGSFPELLKVIDKLQTYTNIPAITTKK